MTYNPYPVGQNYYIRNPIVVLDIEGTITPVSFVREVLVPYAKENVEQYVMYYWEQDTFKTLMEMFRKQCKEDQENNVPGLVTIMDGCGEDAKESFYNNVIWQMDNHRKTPCLKLLQGYIWKYGYETGKLKGQIYPDVEKKLKDWYDAELKIYIYSSGSVESQKFLFRFSIYGDLSEYIDDYFDTAVGFKTDSQSYMNLCKEIGCVPRDITFLTDTHEEAEAARSVGYDTILVERENNFPISEEYKCKFPIVNSFFQLKNHPFQT